MSTSSKNSKRKASGTTTVSPGNIINNAVNNDAAAFNNLLQQGGNAPRVTTSGAPVLNTSSSVGSKGSKSGSLVLPGATSISSSQAERNRAAYFASNGGSGGGNGGDGDGGDDGGDGHDHMSVLSEDKEDDDEENPINSDILYPRIGGPYPLLLRLPNGNGDLIPTVPSANPFNPTGLSVYDFDISDLPAPDIDDNKVAINFIFYVPEASFKVKYTDPCLYPYHAANDSYTWGTVDYKYYTENLRNPLNGYPLFILDGPRLVYIGGGTHYIYNNSRFRVCNLDIFNRLPEWILDRQRDLGNTDFAVFWFGLLGDMTNEENERHFISNVSKQNLSTYPIPDLTLYNKYKCIWYNYTHFVNNNFYFCKNCFGLGAPNWVFKNDSCKKFFEAGWALERKAGSFEYSFDQLLDLTNVESSNFWATYYKICFMYKRFFKFYNRCANMFDRTLTDEEREKQAKVVIADLPSNYLTLFEKPFAEMGNRIKFLERCVQYPDGPLCKIIQEYYEGRYPYAHIADIENQRILFTTIKRHVKAHTDNLDNFDLSTRVGANSNVDLNKPKFESFLNLLTNSHLIDNSWDPDMNVKVHIYLTLFWDYLRDNGLTEEEVNTIYMDYFNDNTSLPYMYDGYLSFDRTKRFIPAQGQFGVFIEDPNYVPNAVLVQQQQDEANQAHIIAIQQANAPIDTSNLDQQNIDDMLADVVVPGSVGGSHSSGSKSSSHRSGSKSGSKSGSNSGAKTTLQSILFDDSSQSKADSKASKGSKGSKSSKSSLSAFANSMAKNN